MEASIPDAAKAAEQTAAQEPKAPGEEQTPADAAVEALPDEEPADEASPGEAFPDEELPDEAQSAVEVSTDAVQASAAPAAEASQASEASQAPEAKQFAAAPAAPGDHHVPAPDALPASNLWPEAEDASSLFAMRSHYRHPEDCCRPED